MRRLVWLTVQQVPLVTLAMWVTVVSAMVFQVSRSVSRARFFEGEAETMAARVLAEEIAWTMARDPSRDYLAIKRHGLEVVARRLPTRREDGVVVNATRADGRKLEFRCEILPGAAPLAFRRPLSVRGEAPVGDVGRWSWMKGDDVPMPQWLADEFPRLLPVSAVADRRAASFGFHHDPTVALTRLLAGTDRQDFVLRPDRDGFCRLHSDGSGVVHLDGHLWIACDGRPLIVELSAPMTVVVRGNIYLDNSLLVRGSGRLILVSTGVPGTEPFADRDFDGRWSRGDRSLGDGPPGGWIEGAGAVYVGLPGRPEQRPAATIAIEAGLVVSGELHVSTACVELRDLLVLGEGVTRRSTDCRLRFAEVVRPRWTRRRLPGFVLLGEPRPSELITH